MKFGDSELLKEKYGVRLDKVGARYDREVLWVSGNGPSRCFDDYEDALDEFNLRWMKAKFRD